MHAKARAAWEARGYDPLTPDGDYINFDDVKHLAFDSWYEDVYPIGDGV